MKKTVQNLEELVHKFNIDKDIPSRRKLMTKMILGYVCEATGYSTIREIPVHKLKTAKKQLSTYFGNTDLSENTKASYNGFFSRLITWGVDHGYIHMGFQCELSEIWFALTYPLKEVSSGRKGWRDALRRLAYWATSQGIEPNQLNNEALLSFIDHLRDDSGIQAWRQIYHRAEKEWNLHVEKERVDFIEWPELSIGSRSRYSVKLSDWPNEMQGAYQKYRAYSMADFDLDRDPKYKQREVSADQNLSNLERMAGYFHHFEGFEIEALSMSMFFNEELVKRYISWMVKERNGGVVRVTQVRLVAQLLGMARGYFQNREAVAWLAVVKDRLDPKPVKDKRTALITREELLRVPAYIRNKRLNILNRGQGDGRKVSERNQANLVLQELLFRLLLERPLRQRNIREMKIEKNLIKTKDGSWLLTFLGEEMKNDKPYEISFPSSLVSLLENYLKMYRPKLCNGVENAYVFPNPNGGHIDPAVIQRIISKNTKEALGKHMTPHLIRDCVAYHVLKNRPGEYHMISLMLSHADVKTTLRIYGHYTPEDAGERYDALMDEIDNENIETIKGKEEKYVARG
jgi:integrase